MKIVIIILITLNFLAFVVRCFVWWYEYFKILRGTRFLKIAKTAGDILLYAGFAWSFVFIVGVWWI